MKTLVEVDCSTKPTGLFLSCEQGNPEGKQPKRILLGAGDSPNNKVLIYLSVEQAEWLTRAGLPAVGETKIFPPTT
jgi:hypothetical protein